MCVEPGGWTWRCRLYLKGIATGQMAEALRALVGPEAKSLSASVVGKLKRQWGREDEVWRARRLDTGRWVYWWGDGIYSGLRGDDERSTSATIRHRSDRAKGCVSRDSMLVFVFKLGLAAEQRWRRIRGFEQLAKITEGVKFNDGVETEDSDRIAA